MISQSLLLEPVVDTDTRSAVDGIIQGAWGVLIQSIEGYRENNLNILGCIPISYIGVRLPNIKL